MKKIKVVALLLAVVMLFAGCSLVSPDEERIAMQVIATVNGVQIYNYEVNEDDVADSVAQMLYYSGMSEKDLTSEQLEEVYNDQRTYMVEALVGDEVMLQKAAELGYVLTEAEKADLMVSAIEHFDSVRDSFVTQIETEIAEAAAEAAGEDGEEEAVEEATEQVDEEAVVEETPPAPAVVAEADARLANLLEESRLSLDIYFEYLCEQELISKVRDYMTGLTQVTEQDAKAWYDQTLAIQQGEMDEQAGSFEELIYANKIYTYVPARVVAVRDVLIGFDDELALEAKDMYNSENREGYDDFLNVLLANADDFIATASDIKARMEASESIDDIVAQMSVDMPNISDPSPSMGYLIEDRTTTYSAELIAAAQGLENVGDVSEPFADYDGVHVLQLVQVYESGVVSFDELRDSIIKALQPGAEQDMYQQMLEAWVQEADIEYFYNRMG